MNLLYGAFAIILAFAIVSNVYIKRPRGSSGSDAYLWSVNGIPYLLMFISLMIFNTALEASMYAFLIASSGGYVWLFRHLEYKTKLVAPALPVGVVTFVVAWTVMSNYLGMTKFSIFLPSVIVLSGFSLMTSAYFFMRTDKEIQLKTVIGALYAIMTVIKVLYIFTAFNKSPIYFIGLFVLDFLVYTIITVLVFLNAYYKSLIEHSRSGMQITDLMEISKEPMALLTWEGDVIYTNLQLQKELQEHNRKINGLKDLFGLFGPEDKEEWWVDALEGFSRGEGCCFPVTDKKDKVSHYLACEVFPVDEVYYIFFRVRSYPAKSFWMGKGRRRMNALKKESLDKKFRDDFEQLIKECQKEDKKVGVMLLRMSNLPSIEEKVGEELVNDFVGVISSFIRQDLHMNIRMLYSNSTFLVGTEPGTFEEIQQWTDQLIEKLSEPYKINTISINLIPELGVAFYPDNGNSLGELVKAAKIALARNTAGSQDRIQYYEAGYKYLDSDRVELENHLRRALVNKELSIQYQPQVDVNGKSFRGFEALIRWELEDGRQISPNIFIPIAEDIGIIEEIGLWVLEEAIAKASVWHQEFERQFMMSVNMSSFQLEKVHFVDQVAELLERYDYLPEYLELEVTEGKILKTSKEVYASLKALKEMGIKIALDDFGTGYSSLDYLRWLPFDVLKIDKSFIDNLGEDTVEQEIVHSVIHLVNRLNLETVAEGVENHDQLKSLQDSSCTYVQGYLFSKPLTDFEAREILLNMD